jgi:hypothetical protein
MLNDKEILSFSGLIVGIGAMDDDDLQAIEKNAIGLMVGGRPMMIIGLTEEECKQLAPQFGNNARLTVSI